MLKTLDLFLTIVHLVIILFNLFGWIPPATRKLHFISICITAFFWLVPGIWFGIGYCPLTDWQWSIKVKLGEVIGEPEKIIDITVAIDKLDKIGQEKVAEELRMKGISDAAIRQLEPIMQIQGSNEDKLKALQTICAKSAAGMKGIEETEAIIHACRSVNAKIPIDVDITLARGLNYYTGAIIEVKASDSRTTFTSSICGGGRYDDLTGVFGLKGVSGVGISFGADRIYDVLEDMKAFPETGMESTRLLFVNFGSEEASYCMKLAARLRAAGINTEVFPDSAKIKKQMSYADSKKIPLVALIGSNEMRDNTVTVKDMVSGEQFMCEADELVSRIKTINN